ncbi:MAG TPA: ABC transporter substrate-binding protein, partial [Chloroflexota bacterium]
MNQQLVRVAAFLLMASEVGCSPAGAVPSSPAGGAAAPGPQPTIVLVSRGDPASLATRPFVANVGTFQLTRVFNATLSFKDEQQAANPYLAESLPRLNTGSWTVTPDGRMTTTWQLRPNLTWHDGAPLTADDFVFASQVYARPDLGAAQSTPIKQIEGIEAPSPNTVVVRWKQLYADAVVENGGFYALPRHVLQDALDGQDSAAFIANPFWVAGYVGAGPFKLTDYVPGDHLDALAFDAHALGRPKIDKIRIRFIGDAHTVVANLLSGDVHFADTFTINPTDGVSLEKDWAASGQGGVLWSPTTIRMALVQWRPDYAEPKALVDLRMRQALAHGFDVPSVIETLNYGKGAQTPSVTIPTTAFYAEIDKVVTRYAYDARRVAQLMEQVGFSRGADGMYADAGGTSFNVEVSSVGDDKNV